MYESSKRVKDALIQQRTKRTVCYKSIAANVRTRQDNVFKEVPFE